MTETIYAQYSGTLPDGIWLSDFAEAVVDKAKLDKGSQVLYHVNPDCVSVSITPPNSERFKFGIEHDSRNSLEYRLSVEKNIAVQIITPQLIEEAQREIGLKAKQILDKRRWMAD